MANEIIEQAVARAVQQAYDAWAAEHPSLAGVIDWITVTQQVASSIRDTDEFRQAVSDYHQSLAEADLVSRLLDIAGAALNRILGF